MAKFWLTLEFNERNLRDANKTAEAIADSAEAYIVSLARKPPQGSLFVGDSPEDAHNA